MHRYRWMNVTVWTLAVAFCLAVGAHILVAQTTATTATTATTGTTGTTGTTSTTSTTSTTGGGGGNAAGAAGVVVDPNGVLRTKLFMDQSGQLMWQKMNSAKTAKNAKVAKTSALRKISLNRLEAAVKERLDGSQQPSLEMKNLAGLTRIQYVFYYPESKDIVIAGPAEEFAPDLSGRVRGLTSGQPVIELDDLVTALRAFAPGHKATSLISCSIDPTQEGLQRMQEFVRVAHANAGPNDGPAIVSGLKDSLGLETISIRGVPASTHFAQVLVEADYRMKLIGIGLERPPVKQLISWIDKVNPSAVSRNALQRWFFVPEYECVKVTEDDLAMELVGGGVKSVGADEVVAPDGTRAASKSIDGASRMFTESFTKNYAQLAAVAPVYAQLRNCIDLAVAAAFIQERDYYGKSGWMMPLFSEEASYPVQTLPAPQQVESMVNGLWRGHTLMTPIGGGVEIKPRKALDKANTLADSEGKVSEQRSKVDLKGLAKGQWWWD